MGSLVLALADGESPLPTRTESWVTPDLLGRAQADESIDLQSICDVATDILYLLSGRRFGVRTETVRPVACAAGYLVLKSPVQSITSVKLDGAVLDEGDYMLYDRRRLFRRGPLGWPTQQDLTLADTDTGTFSVTYSWGAPVPDGGKIAAQVLATELAHYVFKEPCALPDRTVTVTRQGVSQTVLDPSQFIAQARTGLYFVDIWLGSVNPRGKRRRPTISGPDDVVQATQS